MTTRHFSLCSTLFLAMMCCSRGLEAAEPLDESKEPPMTYLVKVGDQSLTIKEGQTGQIQGTLTNPKVEVEIAPHRLFSVKGVNFKYPRTYSYEYDEETLAFKGWTLTGNSVVIMMFATVVPLTPDLHAAGMMEQFGKENCSITKVERNLGGKTYTGKKLMATIAGTSLTVDILQLPAKNGTYRLIAFQDTLGDDGKPSKEAVEVLKTLAESFELK